MDDIHLHNNNSINKYKLNKEVKKGNKKALKIVNLLNDSSAFLSAIQVSITLSGFLSSALAAESFASELASKIDISILSQNTLTTILIIVITIVLSYFTLVFGELVPKKIGIANPDKISYFMVDIIYTVIWFFKPFIKILTLSTRLIGKPNALPSSFTSFTVNCAIGAKSPAASP